MLDAEKTEQFTCNVSGLMVYFLLKWREQVLTAEIRVYHGSSYLWEFELSVPRDDRPAAGTNEIVTSQMPGRVRPFTGEVTIEVKKFRKRFTVERRLQGSHFQLMLWKGASPLGTLCSGIAPSRSHRERDRMPVEISGSWGVLMEPEPDE